jgi:glycosyltransferase involved in cell wall biosynthesis
MRKGSGVTMLPFISVIVPVFNARKYIVETLKSVIDQSYPPHNFEIIVVDDGSTDDSIALAKAVLAGAPQVNTIISGLANRGASSARNIGLAAARGDWIQFLDADDLISPKKLEIQGSVAGALPDYVGAIQSPWQYLERRGSRWEPTEIINILEPGPELVFDLLLHKSLGYVGPKLVRKRHLDAISGFDEKMVAAEDLDVMLRLAMSGAKFWQARSDAPLYFYRLEVPNSLSQSCPPQRGAEMIVHIGSKIESYLECRYPNGFPPSAIQGMRQFYSWALTVFFDHDRFAFARLIRSIRRFDPWFQPASLKKRVVAKVVGYERSEGIAQMYRRSKEFAGVLATLLVSALYRLEHLLHHLHERP